MNFRMVFSLAIQAILLNKVRSFLTMLGVIIGVGSVVLLTSIGTGLQAYVSDQFASLGVNTLYVIPGSPFGESGGFGGGEQAMIQATRPLLKRRYLDKILRNHRELISEGTATGVGVAEVKYKQNTKSATLYGVMASYPKIQTSTAKSGRWFTKTEETKSERVAVLGPSIAEELFGQIDPINKKILLNGQSYNVLGVLEAKGGGFGGPSFDNYIYLPLSSLQRYFDVEVIDSLIIGVESQEQIPAAITAIEKLLLGEGLEDDEFSVFDQTQLLDTINNILGVLTMGLGGIAAISLVVGGIGIMNIMLVSVTERTREIGLRKALGATPKVIMMQFLTEAALLSVLGGSIGLIIAFFGSLALQQFFPAKVTIEAVLLAFSVSTLVGLIFGVAPARRAANLSPIEALRYE